MRIRTFFTVVILTLVSIGFIGSVWATPDGSQRLRGLGDRVFFVTVTLTEDRLGIGLPIGTTFPNCYIFSAEADEDGNNWFETAFPTKGAWTQDSNGAKTGYDVVGLGFLQLGQVTPARGKGVLQLVAESFSDLIPGGPAELEFLSVGEEIDESEVAECPTSAIFTFPDPA